MGGILSLVHVAFRASVEKPSLDRNCRVVQAMVEPLTKRQGLKAAGQSRAVQALVELYPKCQVLKAAGKRRVVQAADYWDRLLPVRSSTSAWPK